MKRPWIAGSATGGVFTALLVEPMACPDCGRAAYVVVNRDGATCCHDCDAKKTVTK